MDFVKNNNEDLFSLGFSILEHPTYMSLKVNFTILLLLLFKNKWQLKNIYFISSLIVLSVVIFLLASKAGIIVFMIIVISVMIRIASTGAKKIITYLLLIPTFIFLSFSIVKNIDRIEWFIHYTELELKSENGDLKKFDQRMREWYTAIQLIKEKPFTGFGLANIEKRMVEEYLRYGFEEEAKLKVNAHNQYLEAQVTFGIAGSISLLMMLLIPLIYRKQIRYPRLMTIFIVMVSFFLLFESMFNRQWGIMFFLLFYCILCLGEKYVNIKAFK
ncbi:MAG: O-antigen ligase family protein [Bacteroidetes bacterium]|nr:O-antigen ligase family protein [Bacteroidota bacterium]